MADDFEVRLGTASDARALSVLAVETFRDAFAHLYSPNDLKLFLESNYTESMQLSELERPDYKTLLLVCKETIIGFCTIRFGSREEQINGPDPVAEIWRFYISKAYIGMGVAKIIMDRVLQVLQENRISVVWLGVWENNIRAQKFYKKFGFEEVGYHDFIVGTTADRDLLFQLNLYKKPQ